MQKSIFFQKKKIIIISIILFLILFVIGFSFYRKRESSSLVYESSLYSWKLSSILEDKERFYQVLKDYNVKVLYQDFKKEELASFDDTFIKNMNSKGITVYHLGGDSSWGREDGYKKIKNEIDRVIEFNENVENSIKGIILDIEPYVSEKEENFSKESFKVYVEQIEKSYSYCQKNNLELLLAIPYWFDSIDDELLEKVIKNSDGISVMNYKIDKTSSRIKREVELANKYGKKLILYMKLNMERKDIFPPIKKYLMIFAI